MKILGIETSCDETSAAVISGHKDTEDITLLSNYVASSMEIHAKTGGIIPEVAAREQIKYIIPTIDQALQEAHIERVRGIPDIDALAVTVGPGLIGSLLVGIETAKTLSFLWEKPIIPVNHLIGHIYANWIYPKEKITLPSLALIVSGGHTDIVIIHSHKKIQWISGTRDDAAGEAFDKIGRLLKLPYPAGPVIEKLANNGNPDSFFFPRPLMQEDTLDFSFSGLKTAVYRVVQSLEQKNAVNTQTVADIAYATQDAIVSVLIAKTMKAAQQFSISSIVLSGGVAANNTLVTRLREEILQRKLPASLVVPPKNLCTDNGAMIATAAIFQNNPIPWQEITAQPELYFE